jgi:hypothetical protein
MHGHTELAAGQFYHPPYFRDIFAIHGTMRRAVREGDKHAHSWIARFLASPEVDSLPRGVTLTGKSSKCVSRGSEGRTRNVRAILALRLRRNSDYPLSEASGMQAFVLRGRVLPLTIGYNWPRAGCNVKSVHRIRYCSGSSSL